MILTLACSIIKLDQKMETVVYLVVQTAGRCLGHCLDTCPSNDPRLGVVIPEARRALLFNFKAVRALLHVEAGNSLI
jgi:hypothetical protein